MADCLGGLAGVVFEQAEIIESVVKGGAQSYGALQRGANLVRSEAGVLRDNGIAVADLGIADTLRERAGPSAPCFIGMAPAKRDSSQRGGELRGLRRCA